MSSIRTFENGYHTIYWGDAVNTLKEKIEDQSIDLIFADPPYGIGKKFGDFCDKWPSDVEYAKWCEKWLDLCVQKLKPSGSLYIMTSTQCAPYIDLYLRDRIYIVSRIIWHYDSSSVQAKRHFGSMYEPIFFCVKDRNNYTFNGDNIKIEARTGAQRKLIDYRKPIPSTYGSEKVPGNVWYYPRVRYRMVEYEDHPTQKPESLLERVILASSNVGDLVLDPFSGSFTTSAVAKRLGRRTIGIDQEWSYIKIGLRRCGIQQTLDGELLRAVVKQTKRRNKDGKRDLTTGNQGALI